jgi:hypothetical protein
MSIGFIDINFITFGKRKNVVSRLCIRNGVRYRCNHLFVDVQLLHTQNVHSLSCKTRMARVFALWQNLCF